MKRLTLFEFGDQAWFGGFLRATYMDCLNFVLKSYSAYRYMHLPMSQWGQKHKEVLDLASGGGGPIDTMVDNARAEKVRLPKFILSDLFPEIKKYKELRFKHSSKKVDFVSASLSALELEEHKGKLFSICSGFHHFSSSQAKTILSQALKHGDGIFIMEPFRRDAFHLCMQIIGGPWIYMIAPFFFEKFSFRKFFICTLLPIIPLMIYWDSIVSVLRAYRNEEIVEMLPKELKDSFKIKTGQYPMILGVKSQYFYAVRKTTAVEQQQQQIESFR